MITRLAFIARTVGAALLLVALAWPAGPARAQGKDLIVFAAASMKNALDDVNGAYQGKTGQKATTSYAASSALAKQIEAGAPAGIFISADLDLMGYLDKKKLLKAGTREKLLGHKKVLIAPNRSTPKRT